MRDRSSVERINIALTEKRDMLGDMMAKVRQRRSAEWYAEEIKRYSVRSYFSVKLKINTALETD